MMELTGVGGLSARAQLKLNASEELSGDQTVGYNHHHSRDEEQSEQQQHIPEKQPEWKEMNNTHREGEKELNQPSKNKQAHQILQLLAEKINHTSKHTTLKPCNLSLGYFG